MEYQSSFIDKNVIFVVLTLTFLGLLIILTYLVKEAVVQKKKKNNALVVLTSERIKALRMLNDTYDFEKGIIPERSISKSLASKQQFDRCDISKLFVEYVATQPFYFNDLIDKLNRNEGLLLRYKAELSMLPPYASESEAKISGLSYRKYRKIEDKQCDDLTLKPITDITIKYTVSYTSPKGRNSYKRSHNFRKYEIKKALESLDKDYERKQSAEYERSLVTPSVRYDIMKRDNFRCVLCGRSAEMGAVLHVDHIVPVSKGGKSEESNLRTLCDRCNLGKGSKYDAKGKN